MKRPTKNYNESLDKRVSQLLQIINSGEQLWSSMLKAKTAFGGISTSLNIEQIFKICPYNTAERFCNELNIPFKDDFFIRESDLYDAAADIIIAIAKAISSRQNFNKLLPKLLEKTKGFWFTLYRDFCVKKNRFARLAKFKEFINILAVLNSNILDGNVSNKNSDKESVEFYSTTAHSVSLLQCSIHTIGRSFNNAIIENYLIAKVKFCLKENNKLEALKILKKTQSFWESIFEDINFYHKGGKAVNNSHLLEKNKSSNQRFENMTSFLELFESFKYDIDAEGKFVISPNNESEEAGATLSLKQKRVYIDGVFSNALYFMIKTRVLTESSCIKELSKHAIRILENLPTTIEISNIPYECEIYEQFKKTCIEDFCQLLVTRCKSSLTIGFKGSRIIEDHELLTAYPNPKSGSDKTASTGDRNTSLHYTVNTESDVSPVVLLIMENRNTLQLNSSLHAEGIDYWQRSLLHFLLIKPHDQKLEKPAKQLRDLGISSQVLFHTAIYLYYDCKFIDTMKNIECTDSMSIKEMERIAIILTCWSEIIKADNQPYDKGIDELLFSLLSKSCGFWKHVNSSYQVEKDRQTQPNPLSKSIECQKVFFRNMSRFYPPGDNLGDYNPSTYAKPNGLTFILSGQKPSPIEFNRLEPDRLNSWFGTAYQTWENVKNWAGYGEGQVFWGGSVGHSDQNGSAPANSQIIIPLTVGTASAVRKFRHEPEKLEMSWLNDTDLDVIIPVKVIEQITEHIFTSSTHHEDNRLFLFYNYLEKFGMRVPTSIPLEYVPYGYIHMINPDQQWAGIYKLSSLYPSFKMVKTIDVETLKKLESNNSKIRMNALALSSAHMAVYLFITRKIKSLFTSHNSKETQLTMTKTISTAFKCNNRLLQDYSTVSTNDKESDSEAYITRSENEAYILEKVLSIIQEHCNNSQLLPLAVDIVLDYIKTTQIKKITGDNSKILAKMVYILSDKYIKLCMETDKITADSICNHFRLLSPLGEYYHENEYKVIVKAYNLVNKSCEVLEKIQEMINDLISYNLNRYPGAKKFKKDIQNSVDRFTFFQLICTHSERMQFIEYYNNIATHVLCHLYDRSLDPIMFSSEPKDDHLRNVAGLAKTLQGSLPRNQVTTMPSFFGLCEGHTTKFCQDILFLLINKGYVTLTANESYLSPRGGVAVDELKSKVSISEAGRGMIKPYKAMRREKENQSLTFISEDDNDKKIDELLRTFMERKSFENKNDSPNIQSSLTHNTFTVTQNKVTYKNTTLKKEYTYNINNTNHKPRCSIQ